MKYRAKDDTLTALAKSTRSSVDRAFGFEPKGRMFNSCRVHVKKLVKGIDHIGVNVVYFCHDGQRNVLMAKRSKNTRDEHGRWDIGGGGLELGETVEETLRKEIKEEYCTDVIEYEFLGYRDVHRQHQGQKTHWIGLDFKVLVDPKKVKNGEPHKFDEVKWFPYKNLPQHSHSQFPTFLKLYRHKLA